MRRAHCIHSHTPGALVATGVDPHSDPECTLTVCFVTSAPPAGWNASAGPTIGGDWKGRQSACLTTELE
ncbi:hypothetical protein GCM10027039_34930 [Terrabacter koreensis]